MSVPREQFTAALVAVQAAAAQDEGLVEVARLVASASARLFRADHFEATEQQVTKAVLAAAMTLRRARADIRAMTLPSRIEAPLIEKLTVGIASLGEVGEQAAHACDAAWDASTHATESRRKGTRKLALVSEDGDVVTATDCAAAHGAGASERREAERVVLEVELGLGSDSNFYTGITMDVSTGGVFVATYQQLPMGALVELAFDLPGSHRVEVDGEVRWLRQSSANDSMPGMGIAFGALRRDDLEAIEAFCRSRTPLYHDID